MNLRELLSKQKFAKNAKILPLLDKKNTSDLDLAKAALTTKAYRENGELKKKVDDIIAGVVEESPKTEPAKESISTRYGERRIGY